MNKSIVVTGTILILVAIIFGAMGAHWLEKQIPADKLASFEVGVRYQFYMAITLLVLGLNEDKLNLNMTWVYRLILWGVMLFSISIYFLSIQSILNISLKFLGPITPLGGTLMIAGWAVFLVKLLRNR